MNAINDISKNRGAWMHEKHVASVRLSDLGGAIGWSDKQYVAFTWTHEKLTLIFYPHQTKSTGNYHIRVRKGRCTDRGLLVRAIFALAENSCCFGFPSELEIHDKAVFASIKNGRALTQ